MLQSFFNKAFLIIRPATLLKRNSNAVVYCEYCEIFKNISKSLRLRGVLRILSDNFSGSFSQK